MRRRGLVLAGCGIALAAAGGLATAGTRATQQLRPLPPYAQQTAARAGVTQLLRPLTPYAQQTAAPAPPTINPPAPVALASGWRFLSDPSDVGLSHGWFRGGAANLAWSSVSIPNDFNPTLSRAADGGSVGWYEETFTGPSITADRSWNVSFESVRRHARVWLNGSELGSSSDPYVPFSLPAKTLFPRGPNVLVVRVDNSKAGSLPEDWWNWGGILGPVTLQPAGRIAVRDLGLIPELGCRFRCGDLRLDGTLTNTTRLALKPDLVVNLTSPAGFTTTSRRRIQTVPAGGSLQVSFRVAVPGPPALWSPADPSLYRAQVQTIAGGRVEQVDALRVGMRTVQVRNGVIYLNGRRLWLHGAAIHEDVKGSGAALADGDIDTIVSQLRSVGANITRAHYLLSKRLLDALDAAGIMVWEEPPVDHAYAALRTTAGRAKALAMLERTLLSTRNHPSVIIDSVGNELSPTPDQMPGTHSYLSQAIPIAQRRNPAVPVALDIYCYPGFPAQPIYSRLGVLGISSYFGWYPGLPGHSIADSRGLEPFLRQTHARYPQQALVVSEFGAEALFSGTPTTKGSYQFQGAYLRRTFAALDRLPFMNGAIYWTLREFAVAPGWVGGAALPAGTSPDGIHHKGLISYDGNEKPAFGIAAQLFERIPGYVR